jgi:catechol 2,3-dioxygenase-like lactoylglutathione lyase family enzyme
MFGFAAVKLDAFEQGRISRRQLIETLTLALSAAGAAGSAQAADQTGVTAAGVNHVSYTCPDFRKAADWYSKVFNLDQVGLKDNQVTLPFGKKGEKPYGVTADDVPLTSIICRTRDLNAPLANGKPRPKASNVINHMAYTVADFDATRVRAELTALGVQNIRGAGPNALHMNDAFGYDVEINGLANNSLTDGAYPAERAGGCSACASFLRACAIYGVRP